MKNTLYTSQTRWSEWMESMRKDVECTFGIMKGRFRVLKAGIRCHGLYVANSIWLTCCALHNMLLEVDGLDGSWDGADGLFDFDEDADNIPFALQRLHTADERRNYDSSGMGPGFVDDTDDTEDVIEGNHIESMREYLQLNERDIDGINDIRNFTSEFFQAKLIEHFDILFKNYKVRWPRVKN